MSMNNLTIDGEFRYIIQWFNEWSELQRDDFVPIMVDYITDTHHDVSAEAAAIPTINMNGLQNDLDRSLNLDGKPMSLFQCRVKLFNQWNRKWPLDFKDKLQQKITEIDNKVGERIKESLHKKYNGNGSLTNGYAGTDDNDDGAHHYEHCTEDTTLDGHQQLHQSKVDEDKPHRQQQQPQQQVENEIMVLTNAVTLNDPMREVLSNETSVDDIELNEDINKRDSGQQEQQVNINGAADKNNVDRVVLHVVHDNDEDGDDDGINEASTTTRPQHFADDVNNDDVYAREPVGQVEQMRNLQINEEDREVVTASAEQQQPHTAAAVPVTVTVNPVVVVVAPAMAANAEVPLVV